MLKESFSQNASGKTVPITLPFKGWAFIPNPLPPPFSYTEQLVAALSGAQNALGRLEGLWTGLSNSSLFSFSYLQREARASTAIEGTQTDSGMLFRFDATGRASQADALEEKKMNDVQEVFNYISAARYGFERASNLPLSLRFVCEIHEILMRGVRGKDEPHSEFRKNQNWIASNPSANFEESFQTARFVPPPVSDNPIFSEMHKALNAWEEFLQRTDVEPLLQCALLHHQFEAIHPFEDGNGRVGRLLCILFLVERKLLPRAWLYLSAYFERHQEEYYDRLLAVSQNGEWEAWVEFFLRGVQEQASDAIQRARLLLAWRKETEKSLPDKTRRFTPRLLLAAFFKNPYITVPQAQKFLRTNYPTAKSAIDSLLDLGILEEVPREKRPKLFLCRRVLDIFAD